MLLNTFPTLLSFSLFAPFILRIVAGCIFVRIGYIKHNLWGIIFILSGLLLILGAFTQITAIVASILSFVHIFARQDHMKKETYILLFVISLSLILTGAGIFAFDLPL